MAIVRYTASADNTIVNAFKPNMTTRATGANAGAADILEIYSVYSRAYVSSSSRPTGSQELSRVLIQFPTYTISADRTAGTIPASGSVKFYLKLYNAETSKTVPTNYSLSIKPIAQSWQEGDGLDLENYTDETRGNRGSNWMSASNTSAWTSSVGGDYLTASADPLFVKDFENGLEDLEVDISPLVEEWIAGTKSNYGMGIMLSSSFEAFNSASSNIYTGSAVERTGGAQKSYYTKRFFARGTQYFYKRPVIEARWDSTKRDDRGDFYYSSSLANAEDNLNTLYLFNYVRGRLRNIPAIGTTGSIMVSLYSGSKTNTEPSGSRLLLYNGLYSVTGGYVSTGVYSCSLAITSATTPIKNLYDVWHSGSHEDEHGGAAYSSTTIEFYTGSIEPQKINALGEAREPTYFINITNLKNSYAGGDKVRLNLYVRNKNWSPTIYSKAKENPEHLPILSASYRVFRTLDGLEVVPHNTGSDFATGLSYDVSGNYFDFEMDLLEPGYEYAFKFSFYDEELGSWNEQGKPFKFRVLDYEY